MATITPDPVVLDDVEYARGDEVPADEHVNFVIDGSGYSLDLSAENFKRFTDALEPWIKVAQPDRTRPAAKPRQAKRSAAAPSGDRERNQSIREWAGKQGMNVSERGRISREIVALYDAAH